MGNIFNENMGVELPVAGTPPNVRLPLSASNNGNPINVIEGSSGTTSVHTSEENVLDELYIWASNYGTGDAVLTLSAGPMSSASNQVQVSIGQAKGLSLVWPGSPLKNETLYAKASAADTINLIGFAIRYYPKKDIKPEAGFYGPYK
jgi:hypothetical protein